MNHMKNVAKMLGLKLNRDFKIKGLNDIFYLTEEGLNTRDANGFEVLKKPVILAGILTGVYTIEKLPFIPRKGDMYYIINIEGEAEYYYHMDNEIDLLYMNMGNCFETKEDALENKDLIMQKYEEMQVKLGILSIIPKQEENGVFGLTFA